MLNSGSYLGLEVERRQFLVMCELRGVQLISITDAVAIFVQLLNTAVIQLFRCCDANQLDVYAGLGRGKYHLNTSYEVKMAYGY